jgi:hypothetical protein
VGEGGVVYYEVMSREVNRRLYMSVGVIHWVMMRNCCYFLETKSWRKNVHYESIKWELKTRPIYECWCDERLKTKDEESTRLVYSGLFGNWNTSR